MLLFSAGRVFNLAQATHLEVKGKDGVDPDAKEAFRVVYCQGMLERVVVYTETRAVGDRLLMAIYDAWAAGTAAFNLDECDSSQRRTKSGR